MAFRRENSRDDDARTGRLLDQSDAAFDYDGTAAYRDDAFVEVLTEGLWSDKITNPYPPTGHTYPKRG